MLRLVQVLLLAISMGAPMTIAMAQTGTTNAAQKQIQLRFSNTLTDKVDYYLSAPGTAPKFVGSVNPRSVIDIKASAGQVWVFAVNRKPFQQYKTRAEIFQNLTLAPKGQQRQPVVANAYQPPPGAKTAKRDAGKADPSVDQPDTGGQLKWFTMSFDDPDSGSRSNQLLHAVPETDNVQMVATCSQDDGGESTSVLLSADMSHLAKGARTKIRFTGSGLNQSFSGRVHMEDSGEGLQGAKFDIPTDDPIWATLARLSSVKYSVGGGAAVTLSLAGLKRPLADYMKSCAKLATGQVASAPPSDNPFGADSCKVAAKIRSSDGGAEVQMTIVNRTNEFRAIDWIDFNGRRVNYANLNAGETFVVNTWTSHPWMASDGPGNCIEIFVASEQNPTTTLTRASPGFGEGND